MIEKISSRAYKLDVPTNMNVYLVFRMGLLTEFIYLTPNTEIPDNIPTSNDFVYGEDHFHVHSITELLHTHKLMQDGPTLLFRVRLEEYDSSEDYWEP
jgi:hypothetical protein